MNHFDVAWSQYATAYDLLLDHNPAYGDLLDRFRAFLDDRALCLDGARVLDAGCGTGNFSKAVLDTKCRVHLTALEPDAGMAARAQKRLGAGASFVAAPFQDYRPDAPFDLIVCTHALYTMPDPEQRLAQMYGMTAPGGMLYLIDLGRTLSLADWRLYLGWTLLRRHGPRKALEIMRRGRQIAQQNQRIAEMQRSGQYWTHTPHRLQEALNDAGWTVDRLEKAYRGYSTLAIARKATA